MSVAEREYQLKAEVKKFEGKFAVLETENEEQLKWPIKELPDEVREGMQVRLIVSTDKTAKEAHERQARVVLNTILDA